MDIVVLTRRVALALLLVMVVLGVFALRAGVRGGPDGVRGDHAPVLAGPVCAVETSQQVVSLSFNVAWGGAGTSMVLDLLEKHSVKATFFVTSFWVRANPSLAGEIATRGHELALHGASYARVTSLSRQALQQELSDNFQSIYETTGALPVLFRPPFGDHNKRTIAAAAQAGYTTVLWSIDARESGEASIDGTVKWILERVKPGDIVAFAADVADMPATVDVVLTRLQDSGYHVVPLAQLLNDADRRNDPGRCP